MSGIQTSVLELIGNTPIVELTNFDIGRCRLFVKLENQNPGGSIKDRMAVAMVEAAERSGTVEARRCYCRSHRGEYRAWARAGGRREEIQADRCHSGQDVYREDSASSRSGSGRANHAHRRGQESSGKLCQSGAINRRDHTQRVVRRSVLESCKSAGSRADHRPGDLAPDGWRC